MTVTFFREARSSAAKRSSRRSRPVARETPVEPGREWGTARGAVATLVVLARLGLIAPPSLDRMRSRQLARRGRKLSAGMCAAGESPASGDGGSPGSARSSHWMKGVIRTRALGVLGATLAAAAVWLVAVPVLGLQLKTRFDNQDAQDVGLGLVLIAALVGSLAGLGLLVLFEKVSTRAITIWTVVAVVVLLASLSLPLVAGTTTPAKGALALMHIAVGSVLITTFRRGQPELRATNGEGRVPSGPGRS